MCQYSCEYDYISKGLKTADRNGNMVSDYFVTIYPSGYMSQTYAPSSPAEPQISFV